MKRHPALQPLSRQHHLGLVIANKGKSATDDDKLIHHQALVEYLTTTIPTHFEIERTRLADVILTKLSDDKAVKLAKQMLDEHEYIESREPTCQYRPKRRRCQGACKCSV